MHPLPFATFCAALFMASPVLSDTYVGSWNLKRLGWDEKDMPAVSRVAASFDLLAVEEVMDPASLNELEADLEAETGASWSHLASEPIGRGDYKESYGFLWRDDQVTWVDGAMIYADPHDSFARDPFSARFRTKDGFEFVLAATHVIYGDDPARREGEVVALDSYETWLSQQFPEAPVFLAGDFNLEPDNPAWSRIGQHMAPMIRDGATTLSPRDGVYANLYDNIWVPSGVDLPILTGGILDYPKDILSIDHERARDLVSDHAPVWIRIGTGADLRRFAPHATHRSEIPIKTGPEEIILANASSGIYHLQNCPGFGKVAKKNRVTFDSREAAERAGYRVAKNCH